MRRVGLSAERGMTFPRPHLVVWHGIFLLRPAGERKTGLRHETGG
jgi:hypothetical protein